MPNQVLRTAQLTVNFAVLSGGESLGKIFALLAFAYLARVLGPTHFGILEFALAVMFFFTLLVDSGLSPFGAREVAKDGGAVTRLTVHIILLRGLMAMVTFAVLFLGVGVMDTPWPVKGVIVLYGLTLFAMPGTLSWVFQGRDMMRYVALASTIRWSLFAAGVFLYVRGPESLWIVPIVEGVALACVVIFYLWGFSRHFGSLRGPIDFSFARSVFQQALPICGSDLVWAAKMYFATVWLGIVFGSSEVGWFGAAHRIVISLHTFVWLYFFNLLPSISRCTQGPLEVLHRLIGKSIQVTAWSAVFLGVLGTAFAEPLITMVYGPQYHDAVVPFQVMIWLVPLAVMSGHYRYSLIAYDKQRLEFLASASGAGLTVALNVILIPHFGSLGAAYTLVASEALIWGLAYYFVRRMITLIPIWSAIWQPLGAAVIVAGILSLLPPIDIWIAGATAVVLYCLALSILHPTILSHARSIFARDR